MIFIKVCGSFKFDGSSTSFGKFSQWTPCHNGTIEFEFRTNVSNALLFYIDSGDKQKNPDYFELKLIDGLMHLRFKLNREIDMVSSAMGNLNDNEWHLVKLMRVGRQTTLVVDKATIMKEHQNFDIEYKTFGDSVDNYVYIGGLPNIFNTQLEKLAQPHVKYEPRLRGSVRNLFYSNCGKEMTKPDLLDSQGLVLADDQCIRNNPCLNGGICVTRDRGMQCDCSATEFTGEFCQIAKNARQEKRWNRIFKAFANSLDPDETPQKVASHLDPNYSNLIFGMHVYLMELHILSGERSRSSFMVKACADRSRSSTEGGVVQTALEALLRVGWESLSSTEGGVGEPVQTALEALLRVGWENADRSRSSTEDRSRSSTEEALLRTALEALLRVGWENADRSRSSTEDRSRSSTEEALLRTALEALLRTALEALLRTALEALLRTALEALLRTALEALLRKQLTTI
ncbi:hypothetical protein DPMN_086906 [Dreissena polymorpha]|uniref:Uncharacterized protein n=1 Tax=Dreissena polymorpha TaxID=45954 RepID=A0A9D4KSR3_DREPO|nr:hypothetical protein DPMN_086906 [Dreissena polymorpha]